MKHKCLIAKTQILIKEWAFVKHYLVNKINTYYKFYPPGRIHVGNSTHCIFKNILTKFDTSKSKITMRSAFFGKFVVGFTIFIWCIYCINDCRLYKLILFWWWCNIYSLFNASYFFCVSNHTWKENGPPHCRSHILRNIL